MEVWDLYDRERNLIGEHLRGQELTGEGYHLVVHVWIRRADGKYLISRRAADRPTYPLLYECVGGAVRKGESSLSAALRETREEVGADLDPEKGRLVFSRVRDEYHDMVDVWLFTHDGGAALENATTAEACEISWLAPDEIMKLDQDGVLVPTLGYFFEKIANPPERSN